MSLNLIHQTSYPEYINNHLSNDVMIRQKYESMSQSDYSCENHHLNTSIQHHENVDKYLNFGDELQQANNHHHNILENFDHIHNGVKQEDLDCDFLAHHELKHQLENGMGFDQNLLSFTQNGNLLGDASSYFMYKQQQPAQMNAPSAVSSVAITQPTTGAGQSLPLTLVDNSQLSAKMKRIMKREKAKSRRKLTLEKEQQQQQQNLANMNEQSSLNSKIMPIIPSQQPIVQQIQNIDDTPCLFNNKSSEFANNQQQQIEMRSCSTSCSSSNTAQFEVKIEQSSYPTNSSVSTNGKINPAHLLEQKLKSSNISLNHEELQLKALQQCSGNMDSKQQKKVMQMIRNRISAQNSRDRKKAYISKLESDKEDCMIEGIELRQQLNEAQVQIGNEKRKNEILTKEIEQLKMKLQNQCKCFNTNPEKMQQEQMNSSHLYPKQHHNSLQKNYAAFSVAFFAVLGVVLIFNAKPTKNEQAIINQSSQMMKMLDDLQKSTQDYQKMNEISASDKVEAVKIDSSILGNKNYKKHEINNPVQDEESHPNNLMEEEEIIEDLASNQPTSLNLNMLSKQYQSEQIQKDQWIQFMVPKQDNNNNQRDDVSRDSAETDVTHNSTQKYLQVWAQIKSVQEFEHAN